jgi:FkbH-like protein
MKAQKYFSEIVEDNVAREKLLEAIRLVLPKKPGVALIHSDLSNFRVKDKDFIWSILYAVEILVTEGWTLLFPSFTFSFCSGKPFSHNKSPSETGILADKVLLNFSGAKRTAAPIYSFVSLGKETASINSLLPKTTFGFDSVFEWLEKQNAQVVMLGCDWKYCTQFHRYEELAAVKYRDLKTFKGTADYGEGAIFAESTMFVRSIDLEPINDFSPAVSEMEASDLIKKATIFDVNIQSSSVNKIKYVCLRQLEQDPFSYLSNKNEVLKRVREFTERNKQDELSISVFSSKNTELFERYLKLFLDDLVPERKSLTHQIPFGQMYKSLIDQAGNVYRSPPFIKIFIDRFKDLPGVNVCDRDKTLAAVFQYAKSIKDFHEAVGGWSVVHLFAKESPTLAANQSYLHEKLIVECNEILFDELKSVSQVVLVNLGAELASYDGASFDPRLEFIGKFPFSDSFSSYLARRWVSLVIAMLGKDVRLIIVDLDNTLWGGVLGEEGMEGLQLGGDYPGNAFKALQAELLEHQKRGVALGVASKNDEDLALKAISEMPDMLIREQNIQVHGINWEPKWKNIDRMAAELNLGLSSVMFIDDNPVERESVKRNLPDVKVLPLTDDPAQYVSILRSSPYLQPVTITDEDLGRLKDFSISKERNALKAKAVSLDDYYYSLGISLNLNDISASNSSRAAQLCQKTNQFNTTTRRYDQKQLYALKQGGHEVLVINYADKFSPPENIGLLVIKYHNKTEAIIDLFLLSCRVLGRGIEAAIPNIAAKIVAAKGIGILKAEIIETERNTPARNVYKEAGFMKFNSDSIWKLETKKQIVPKWIEYSIKKENPI